MARYIDAEELYRRLYEGWHTNDTEKAKNIQAVIDMVVTPIMAGMPTADVVPKSEVDRLVDKWIGEEKLTQDEKTLRLIEALRDEAKRYERYYFNHEYDKLIADAKQEVAREIFEGIWELVLAKSFFGEDSVILHIDEGEYERFKKKYTESEE